MDINMWHECMTEYYMAIKINETLAFTVIWMIMEYTVQRGEFVYIILKSRSYRREWFPESELSKHKQFESCWSQKCLNN